MYVTEMKMPSAFVNLSVDEMEYDGEGFFSNLFKGIAIVCGVVAAIGLAVVCAVPAGCFAATVGLGMLFGGLAGAAGLGLASRGKYFI